MQTLKVLVAMALALAALFAVQYARGRARQLPNRPHSVELPR